MHKAHEIPKTESGIPTIPAGVNILALAVKLPCITIATGTLSVCLYIQTMRIL